MFEHNASQPPALRFRRSQKRVGRQTRPLLLVGFGGLLTLLAFTGLTGLSVLRDIQSQNERIRQDYFYRDRILEEMRSEIYLSGTYVRDLLLEQDPRLADTHRRELTDIRAQIDANVAEYNKILRPEEKARFRRFTNELNSYFDSLQPALEWTASERRAFGYAFMKNSLLPRRMMIVHLADQVGRVNQEQMLAGDRQIAALYSNSRRLLEWLLGFTLLAGVGLAGGSIDRILRLENESSQRFGEVEQARAALRDLSARLIAVQESERRALSRELHDEVGQSISALLLGLGNASALLSSDSQKARAQLQELRHLAERTMAVVRDMSLLLRPSMLDDLGLIPALQWQAREVSRTKNLRVQVEADDLPDYISDEQKTCIYRIVQEALHNVARHAKAQSVHVKLTHTGSTLSLTIEDDGQGFAPEREKGVGLLGMEERVVHLNGSFQVASTPGKGTRIRVDLPLEPHAAAVLT